MGRANMWYKNNNCEKDVIKYLTDWFLTPGYTRGGCKRPFITQEQSIAIKGLLREMWKKGEIEHSTYETAKTSVNGTRWSSRNFEREK